MYRVDMKQTLILMLQWSKNLNQSDTATVAVCGPPALLSPLSALPSPLSALPSPKPPSVCGVPLLLVA